MKVRQATIQDLNQLGNLFDGYRVFYRKSSDIASAKDFLSCRLQEQDSVIYVCEDDKGTLLGFTQLYPLFSSTKMKRLWMLNDLFVSPEARGNGVSVLLINRAKQLIRDSGACGMMLETEKSNTIGNNLYPRTGFQLMTETNYYEWLVE